MIRDEDGALTGYVYIDLNTKDYGGFVASANNLFHQKLALPPGYTYKWSGEYEFELRAKERLQLILPVVFCVIFLVAVHGISLRCRGRRPHFSHDLRADRRTHSPENSRVQLQRCRVGGLHRAVWHCRRNRRGHGRLFARKHWTHRLASGVPLRHEDIETAVIEGAVQRLRPKLMTVSVVLASLFPFCGRQASVQT